MRTIGAIVRVCSVNSIVKISIEEAKCCTMRLSMSFYRRIYFERVGASIFSLLVFSCSSSLDDSRLPGVPDASKKLVDAALPDAALPDAACSCQGITCGFDGCGILCDGCETDKSCNSATLVCEEKVGAASCYLHAKGTSNANYYFCYAGKTDTECTAAYDQVSPTTLYPMRVQVETVLGCVQCSKACAPAWWLCDTAGDNCNIDPWGQ